MPQRIITATSTAGTNADKVHGTYVSFDTINSDTGTVANAHVTSATLYISSYKTYISSAYFNVIFGNNSGTVVARTNNLADNSNVHSSTETLINLNAALLTVKPTQMRIGVCRNSGSTSGNCANLRNGCTITLTINYEYDTTAVSAPTSVSLSSSTAAPGAGVTLSWSGAKAGTNNAISGYHIYRRNTLVTTSYTHIASVTSTATSGSCTVTAPTVKGGKYTYAVYTLGAAGLNSGAASSYPTLTANISFTDPTLTMESTPIKAVHMTELQNQVKELLSYYGKSASTFTTITAGTTKLSGWSSHINELRTAYDKLGFTHDTWISIPTNCPNVAVMNQLRKITTTLPDISSGGGGNTGTTTTTTTGTKTPASTTIKPQSKVTWKTSDTSSENASYSFSSATTGQVSTTLDLTSIPSNATINSATLTWSNSKSSTPSPYKLGSASHGVYVNGTDDAHKIGAITANTGDCKSLLVPGQVNTIYAKFYQAGASFTAPTSGSSLSHTVTYTVSNLKLTITYTA